VGLPRGRAVLHVSAAVAIAVAINTHYATSSALDIDMQLYSGNNRDGNGFGGASMAFRAKDTPTYWQALAQDIQLLPMRFLGLLVHKWAASWSSLEFGNNIDYLQTRAISPTLQALHGDFALLAVGAAAGLAALWPQRRALAWGWLAALGLFTLALMATFALSRLRYPAVVLLLPLWSVAAAALADALHKRGGLQRLLAGAGAGIAASVVFPMLVASALIPPKLIFDALPPDARPLNVRLRRVRRSAGGVANAALLGGAAARLDAARPGPTPSSSTGRLIGLLTVTTRSTLPTWWTTCATPALISAWGTCPSPFCNHAVAARPHLQRDRSLQTDGADAAGHLRRNSRRRVLRRPRNGGHDGLPRDGARP
jgi:hypothetical protein